MPRCLAFLQCKSQPFTESHATGHPNPKMAKAGRGEVRSGEAEKLARLASERLSGGADRGSWNTCASMGVKSYLARRAAGQWRRYLRPQRARRTLRRQPATAITR
jgi:hypothetical protein